MRAYDRLRQEATLAAVRRGHKLTRFARSGWRIRATKELPTIGLANCTNPNCRAWVLVDTRPLPNGIDLGGPAVAVGCPLRAAS